MTESALSSPSQPHSDLPDVMDFSVTENEEFLVQVRAQVMTRDDSSGGWLPTNGGGMSVVGVRAAAAATVTPATNQYMIHGRRVCDQAEVLNCAVNDDLLYVKATPTFHHWRTCGKRFGLTFHSSADAQVFETCIQQATHHLQERSSVRKQDGCGDDDDDDDEVTMLKLQPPVDAKEVSSLPASRTRTPSPCATLRVRSPMSTGQRSCVFACPTSYHPFSCPHLDCVGDRSAYFRHNVHRTVADGQRKRDSSSCVHMDPSVRSVGDGSSQAVRNDGYVRFSRTDVSAESSASATSCTSGAMQSSLKSTSRLTDSIPTPPTSSHDYEYPVVVTSSGRPRETSLPPSIQHVSLPRRKVKKPSSWHKKSFGPSARARCIYCQELFFVSENRCGACPDAPDDCAACIEHATCLCAARALLYHCATDDDGNYGGVCGAEESSPGSNSISERRRRRKWALLAVLSIVLPCLWCYPALSACHRCAVQRGHCGARHKAA